MSNISSIDLIQERITTYSPNPINFRDIEMFKRVEQAEIEELVSKVGNLTVDPPENITAFREGDYQHPVFSQHDWPIRAMRAHALGQLSAEKYAALMLYNECFSHDAQVQVLKGDQMRSQKGELATHFQLQISGHSFGPLDNFFRLLDEGDEVFVIKHTPNPNTLISAIHKILNYQFIDKSKGVFYVFTPSTFCKLLDSVNPNENKLAMKLMHGLANAEEFEDLNFRPIFIPNSLLNIPKKIDGAIVDSHLGVYVHDLYFHFLLDTFIGDHREVFVELAKTFKFQNSEIYEIILDRQCAGYLPVDQWVDSQDSEEKFADSLTNFIFLIHSLLRSQKFGEKNPLSWEEDSALIVAEKKIKDQCYTFFRDNQDLLEKHKISLKRLQRIL